MWADKLRLIMGLGFPRKYLYNYKLKITPVRIPRFCAFSEAASSLLQDLTYL